MSRFFTKKPVVSEKYNYLVNSFNQIIVKTPTTEGAPESVLGNVRISEVLGLSIFDAAQSSQKGLTRLTEVFERQSSIKHGKKIVESITNTLPIQMQTVNSIEGSADAASDKWPVLSTEISEPPPGIEFKPSRDVLRKFLSDTTRTYNFIYKEEEGKETRIFSVKFENKGKDSKSESESDKLEKEVNKYREFLKSIVDKIYKDPSEIFEVFKSLHANSSYKYVFAEPPAGSPPLPPPPQAKVEDRVEHMLSHPEKFET